MSTYYFTFGSGMHDTHGRSLLDYYTTIEAGTESEARTIYYEKYGDKWSFTYTDPEFQEQIVKYGLHYLPFDEIDLCSGVSQEDFINIRRKVDAMEAANG
jgi:hypothetical protein